MPADTPDVRLRPVDEDDLAMIKRFVLEPGLIGLDWSGFRDPGAISRRFETDGYLGEDDGRLIVDTGAGSQAAGMVSYIARRYGNPHSSCWNIGIALLPEWRGQGIGWRAQAMLCSYLFAHTPVQRIEAATHMENIAEQRSLERAGFVREGVLRAVQFRGGGWRDGCLYSRLRGDGDPLGRADHPLGRAD